MLTQYDAVTLLIQLDRPNIASSGEFQKPNKHQADVGESGLGAAVFSVLNTLISSVRRSQVRIAQLANTFRAVRKNLEDERVFHESVTRLSRLSPHLLDDIGLLPTKRPKPYFTPEVKTDELTAKRTMIEALRNTRALPTENLAPDTFPVALAAE